jgi:hypothetical protein
MHAQLDDLLTATYVCARVELRLPALAAGLRHNAEIGSTWPVLQRLMATNSGSTI